MEIALTLKQLVFELKNDFLAYPTWISMLALTLVLSVIFYNGFLMIKLMKTRESNRRFAIGQIEFSKIKSSLSSVLSTYQIYTTTELNLMLVKTLESTFKDAQKRELTKALVEVVRDLITAKIYCNQTNLRTIVKQQNIIHYWENQLQTKDATFRLEAIYFLDALSEMFMDVKTKQVSIKNVEFCIPASRSRLFKKELTGLKGFKENLRILTTKAI